MNPYRPRVYDPYRIDYVTVTPATLPSRAFSTTSGPMQSFAQTSSPITPPPAAVPVPTNPWNNLNPAWNINPMNNNPGNNPAWSPALNSPAMNYPSTPYAPYTAPATPSFSPQQANMKNAAPQIQSFDINRINVGPGMDTIVNAIRFRHN